VHQQGSREAVYEFEDAGWIDLQVGPLEGQQFPVAIPVGGLHLGTARAQGMPPLTFRLTEPAKGYLDVRKGEEGRLILRGTVLVETTAGRRSATYDLAVTTEFTEAPDRTVQGERLESVSGHLQLVTARTVRAGERPEGFYAVVSGRFDALPPGFKK
jgi:hypothetical protein